MIAREITVRGKVQGVFYRASAKARVKDVAVKVVEREDYKDFEVIR